MELTPYQEDIIKAKICPYCKSPTRVVTEQEVYGRAFKGRAIIACKNFPQCDSYVGTHEDGEPLGRLADKLLRKHKAAAHEWFDKIWKENFVERGQLYEQLSDFLKIPDKYTHIGMFSEKTCLITEIWAKNYYNQLSKNGKR